MIKSIEANSLAKNSKFENMVNGILDVIGLKITDPITAEANLGKYYTIFEIQITDNQCDKAVDIYRKDNNMILANQYTVRVSKDYIFNICGNLDNINLRGVQVIIAYRLKTRLETESNYKVNIDDNDDAVIKVIWD